MFLDVSIVADLLFIYGQLQLSIGKSLHHDNAKCYYYDYKAGKIVFKNTQVVKMGEELRQVLHHHEGPSQW